MMSSPARPSSVIPDRPASTPVTPFTWKRTLSSPSCPARITSLPAVPFTRIVLSPPPASITTLSVSFVKVTVSVLVPESVELAAPTARVMASLPSPNTKRRSRAVSVSSIGSRPV
jgi:hypothetical protein